MSHIVLILLLLKLQWNYHPKDSLRLKVSFYLWIKCLWHYFLLKSMLNLQLGSDYGCRLSKNSLDFNLNGSPCRVSKNENSLKSIFDTVSLLNGSSFKISYEVLIPPTKSKYKITVDPPFGKLKKVFFYFIFFGLIQAMSVIHFSHIGNWSHIQHLNGSLLYYKNQHNYSNINSNNQISINLPTFQEFKSIFR